MNEHEDAIVAAKRELSEESGYSANSCEIIGYFFTNNRRSDEKQYVVVCTDLKQHVGIKDDEEFIESSWLAVDTVRSMLARGEFVNMNLLAGLNLWLSRST